MMVKPCYVGPTMQEPAFHADAPGGEHFSHRVAEIAVGVDSERAVALAVELLSFDLPARGSEARRREARL